MSQVKIQGNASGTGIFTIASPNSNNNQTLTLPDNTGTLLSSASTIANNGPAFSAYQNATTTVNNSTATKIALQVEEFDTASAFDSTTNYRFQPQVAGYYQVTGCINFAPNSSGFRFVSIYKNGSNAKNGNNVPGGSVNYLTINVSALIYLNGSTDYVELYGSQNSGSNLATSGNADVYFQAFLARAA